MIKAKVNTIYVLDSVPDGEIQTGYNLYHDTVKRYAEYFANNTPIIHKYFTLSSKADFRESLEYIKICSEYSYEGVLIHVESHGSPQGITFKDGTKITWDEIKSELINVNVVLDNQLFISMASCFGRYLYKAIDFDQKAPFCAFISANREIYPSEIEEYFEPFFEELIKTRDFVQSYSFLVERDKIFYYADVQYLFEENMEKHRVNYRTNQDAKQGLKNYLEEEYKKSSSEDMVKEYLLFSNLTNRQFDSIYEETEQEFIKKIKENFLFGKGRNMSRPVRFRRYD